MSRPRPARTQVRHGMASCGAYGCTRPECRDAYTRDRRRADKDRRRGITGRVPADRAAHRIQELLRAGMSLNDISDRSGISATPIRALARGDRTLIARTTNDAILGVPIPTSSTPRHQGFVDATGAIRRLQALSAVGFTRPYLAARLDVSQRNVGEIRAGAHARVRIVIDQRIRRLYDELWNADPIAHGLRPDRVAALRLHAIRQHWPMPADLDDDHIDWPDAA